MLSRVTASDRATIAALRRNELFRALPVQTLARLASSATVLKLLRGHRLPDTGARPPGIHVVIRGSLMLAVGTPESRKILELVHAGGVLALASVILGVRETVSTEALSDTTLQLLPRTALMECASDTPALAIQFAKALGRQLRNLTEDIESYSLHTGRKRVADYLLRVAAESHPPSDSFSLPAKKSIIASRLSLTPEYFSRTLHELIAAGAIMVSGRQITLLDASRLL